MSRRGRSLDSVTPVGASLPLPEIVTTVVAPLREVRTRSIAVSAGSTGMAVLGLGVEDAVLRTAGEGLAGGATVPAAGAGVGPATGAGLDGDAALACAPTSSRRIVLRALLTMYSTPRGSVRRTRATVRPSGDVPCCSRTAVTSPCGCTWLVASPTLTSRSSTTSVSASGRATVYATGSVASMTTELPCAETLSNRLEAPAAVSIRLPAPRVTTVITPATPAAARIRAFAMSDALYTFIAWNLSTGNIRWPSAPSAIG